MTNLKDLVRTHLAFWEAFCISCQKNKITLQILTKHRADAGREDQGFSAFFLPLAHYHLTNSRLTATKPPATKREAGSSCYSHTKLDIYLLINSNCKNISFNISASTKENTSPIAAADSPGLPGSGGRGAEQ